MYLSDNSIQHVREASIKQVIGHYIKIDRNGLGLCPFHNEKSPSFKVSESKGIFKCFGCGKAGDIIGFVQEHDKLDFIAAVQKVAEITGLQLEYEDAPDKEKYEKQKVFKDEMKTVIQFAVNRYRELLWDLPADDPVRKYVQKRRLTRNEVAEWQLGWATTEWRNLVPEIISNGWYDVATKAGLVKRTKDGDSNFDGYRSRLIIPITNHHGEFVGLAGRYIEVDPADRGKDFGKAKYINPPENDLYSKSAVLFGLSKAIKSIQRLKFAFIVEGYFDVIAMHKNGDENTVGTCGTALTLQQAALLKRYTDRAILLLDGDNAGVQASQRALPILLRSKFKVEIIQLPKDEDPDSFIAKSNTYSNGTLPPHIDAFHNRKEIVEDAIYWQINILIRDAAGDEFRMGAAKQSALELISNISDEMIRSTYLDAIIKKYKWPKVEMTRKLQSLVSEQVEKDPEFTEDSVVSKLPKWMNKEEFLEGGFCTVSTGKNTGYWTYSNAGQSQLSNFIIHPLFHVSAGAESRHLIEVQNNNNEKAVFDVESKLLVSPELLQATIVREGSYIFYGQKINWLRIATQLLYNFRKCTEVEFLGWQDQGFWAFVDKVFIPEVGLMDLDKWGIIAHKDRNFLIPAASAAYAKVQSQSGDPYETDRVHTYTKPVITYTDWATLMQRVYLTKGIVAVAYTVLTIFRDIIFSIGNSCPHLNAHGEKSAGKSMWAESLTAVFYKNRSFYNLNSGTDFSFFSYMQRFKNGPAALNEFDANIVSEKWFGVIKGAYDGEGRQRGVAGSRNRTETMHINSTLILLGQYINTQDDNSVVSRSLTEHFAERAITQEDKDAFDYLKDLEKEGLTHVITEVIAYRKEFKALYKERYNEILSSWRTTQQIAGKEFNQRIMQNWCHLYSCYDVISRYIKMPMAKQDFETYCISKALDASRFIRGNDVLRGFWTTLSYLVDKGSILEGWDYKIEDRWDLKVRINDEVKTIEFGEATKILFLRMNNVHKEYLAGHRLRHGKEGLSMENLDHYLSTRDYFVGPIKNMRFKKWVTVTENIAPTYSNGVQGSAHPGLVRKEDEIITSCVAFRYDLLDLDIERFNPETPDPGFGYQPAPKINGKHPAGYEALTQDIPFPPQ
jgi:DNA primase